MVDTAYAVQNSYVSIGEQQQARLRANRRGEIVTPDPYTQLVQDGRVYMVSNATQGTALAVGGTSYAATTPAFLIDAPSGTTIIPLEVRLVQGGTVAGGDITIMLSYDNKVRYSSGGTALTARAMRADAPNSTTASIYQGATAAAAGITPTLAYDIQAADVTIGANVFEHREFLWRAKDSTPPVLVGPASFLVFTFAGVTQPSWFFSIVWVEMPSTAVV